MKRTRDAGKASVAILVTIAILAAVGIGGWLWTHQSNDQQGKKPISTSQKPTFTSPDKNATLTVPPGAMPKGTKVTFTPAPAEAPKLNRDARGVTSAGTPMNVHVTRGSLPPNKVVITLKYDPAKIPTGLSAKQVGMAVFDTNLDAWVPILDAKVDARHHTVTAIAPHFSLFDTIVLNPGKAVVHIGGKTIHVVVDGGKTVAGWFKDFVAQLSNDLIKDLFGVAPSLSCNPRSGEVIVSTHSLLNRLTACTERTKSADTAVRMRNGFAFPLRSQKLPRTMTLRFDDVWGNGSDLVNLTRSTFWFLRGKAVLTGANLSSMTATSGLKQEKVGIDVDVDAIPWDMALSVLMAIAPEQGLVKEALKSVIKSGKAPKGKPGSALSWATATFDALDCIVNAAHQPSPQKAFTKDGLKWAADTAHSCLSSTLANFNLEGALASLLDFVKVIPETLQSATYGLFEMAKQQVTQKDFDRISVTVKRDPFGAIAGTWYIGAVNVSVLKIGPDGRGTLRINAGPCHPDDVYTSTDVQMCDSLTDITFRPNGNGRFTGTYGTTIIAAAGKDVPFVGSQALGPSINPGSTFNLWQIGPDALKSDKGNPGNPYICRQGKWSDYSHCG